MSLERGLQLFVGALLLLIGWAVARAVRTGRWGVGKRAYRRAEEPAEYWFHLLWAVLAAATFVWLIATPADRLQVPAAWRFSFVIFFGVPACFWLVRSLQTGSTGLAELSFSRKDEPGPFWLLILGHVGVIAFAAWAATGWGTPPPPSPREQVEPVLAAVRRELAPAGAAGFRNVRIDPASGLVCGEVSEVGGPVRRFFGTGPAGSARVTVESELLPDFETGYRQVCSG